MSVTETFDDHLAPLLPVEMNLMTIWPCLCWLTNSMTIWPCLCLSDKFNDHLAPLLPVEMNFSPVVLRTKYLVR
jgi:hypothetical protein